MRSRLFKRVAAVITITLIIGVVITWLVGSSFIKPVHGVVGAPPSDLPCEVVTIHSQSGAELHGWFVGVPDTERAVLLLHSSGGDRTSMNTRARILRKAGYATLRFDFRAHGESTGDARTWGWYESRDAISGVAWLRKRLPNAKIGVLGTSLGGASALLAKSELNADAIVVEAVFSDLRKAVWNRVDMRIGSYGADVLSPLLAVQVPMRLGIDIDDISPVKAAAFATCPVFVIHGELDQHAHLEEGRAIFDAIPSLMKQWWQIPNAAHVDLCKFAGEEYERRVLNFLGKTLR
jgi:dipeptidyl aminopeptidase/acylaminoacyl peptidase